MPMAENAKRSAPEEKRSLWSSWWDGLWLCVGFGIAAGLSFSIPSAAIGWMVNASKGNLFYGPVGLVGVIFLVLASPILLSRIFRELDFPGKPAPPRARRVETPEPEPATPG